MMTDKEFESLKQDILINGLREPIYLHSGKIIDGRNRYKACIELGIEPAFRNYEGNESDLIDFVISLNLHRRHLNSSQKACLSVEILPDLEAKTKENLSKKMSAIRKGEDYTELPELNSSEIASKIFGVSERYIFEAKKLYKDSKQLFQEVKDGNLTLQQAKKRLNENEDSAKLQKPNVWEGKEPTKYDWIKINRLVSGLGVSEKKAMEFVMIEKARKEIDKNLSGRIPTTKTQNTVVKFKISFDEKNALKEKARKEGKSVSEILRSLISTSF